MNINELIQKAKESDGYFILASLLDKNKSEGNLTHHIFRKNFSSEDVVPSMDIGARMLEIRPVSPIEPTMPPKAPKDAVRPLRVAIMSHFNRMPQSYSPARAVKRQIKILTDHGHKVVFFVQENSKLTNEDLGCEVRHMVTSFKREKMVVNVEAKEKFIKMLKEQLTGQFDVAITHDFFLQDTVTYSEAIRECGVDIPWLHFARSGVGHDMTFAMPNAKFVYLNYNEIGKFARAIKVKPEQCRTVFNEKDICYMFDFHPITRMIINRFELWNRDIIMTYPLCSTRLAAKGMDDVVRIFSALKKSGKKVCLIVANANGRKRVDDLKREQEAAKFYGLNEDEFIFTSLLADQEYQIESEVPNIVCAELQQVSNLFIAASRAEVGPNVLLEASIAKNLIVVNSDLQLNYDFVDKNAVLSHPMTSNCSIHYSGRDEKDYDKLARQIIERLDQNWSDKQFRFVWRNHNSEAIYQMLSNVLYEDVK